VLTTSEQRIPRGLKRLRRDCDAATRLGSFFHFTRGLRPGLTAKPPLRGSGVRLSIVLFHLQTLFRVVTQSLKPAPDDRNKELIGRTDVVP
jgi:hypothetical protein